MFQPLITQIELINAKDEEKQDSELWNPDSLCFRYFNMLQWFKVNNKVSECTID